MNSKDVTPELLQRYLQHECTPEEEVCVNAWYAALNDREVQELPLTPAQQDILERSMLRRIKQTLGEQEPIPFMLPQRTQSYSLFYRVAASIAILALAIGAYWLTERVALNPGQGQVSNAAETRYVVNTSKTILRQSLPDGSVVWLQPGSEINYPAAFSTTGRTLQLKGEAFFSIARDPSKPFFITSGNVVTRVLGTSFNIRAYDNAPSIEVSVMTGKVSVNIQDSINTTPVDASSVSLVAQQRARYVKAQHRLEKQEGQDLPELDIWKSTTFIFDNEPLRNVLPLLNEKFSVRIEAENKALMNCLLRADLSNLNLPDILEMLSLSVDATYELEGNTIRLRGQGCSLLPNP
ncbi:FecR domain-containing protein [Fulvivirgaceae bacterium PWU5]|uniref:FecR domain-containing protein n=1 Tax=Dawidia cretensis TaxID=2782350 RepID=A0AAP2E3W9_9BACT|nr:FecR domain-containing protein [Dawidia cretensis]MBT1711669.1 FecR domain-containing protein [Dawidia cretensis]